MALIDCPECGKQVSSNATACPSCGEPIASATLPYVNHEVAAIKASPETDSDMRTTNKRNMGFAKFATVTAVVLVLVAKFNQCDPSGERARVPTSASVRDGSQPIVIVELSRLVKECEENQVAFEDAWAGKTVQVDATVKEIDAGLSGGTLQLRKPDGTRWDWIPAFDISREVLGTLSKGEQVTIRCERVYESMGKPALGDCSLPYR